MRGDFGQGGRDGKGEIILSSVWFISLFYIKRGWRRRYFTYICDVIVKCLWRDLLRRWRVFFLFLSYDRGKS